MSGDDTKEHFVGFTLAELTVIACAIEAHRHSIERMRSAGAAAGVTVRSLVAPIHTRVMKKIETYCDWIGGDRAPCSICNDRGVIETGNNDFPCDCRAGDVAIFNTECGAETGAQIKARRR